MTQLHICPHGHEWQASSDRPGVCPRCGTEPETLESQRGGSTRDDLPPPPNPPARAVKIGEADGPPPPSSGDATRRAAPALSPSSLAPPPNLAHFEILGVLGRGGMGVVYKARHIPLKRLVALKMILAAEHADPEELARFRAEAEAVAQLQHPHIVQIHEVGEQDGRPYLALEYVGGGNLAERLAGNPQPPEASAQLTATLARAIHFAHGRGIVHRDLKPANVLLQESGEPRKESAGEKHGPESRTQAPSSSDPWLLTADCLPKITDFGLAKRLDVDSQRTRTGVVMGTPSYMAPEQAAGRTRELGPACDIYALGAILYELLTGRPPFKGLYSSETLQQVLTQEPVPPMRLQPNVPRDLETVCLKCLHKDAAKRYASAEALAADLDCYRTGKPIQARPASRWEKARKWAKRKPAAAALLAVSMLGVLAFLCTILVYSTWLRDENQRYLKERDAARHAEADAKSHQDRAQRNLKKALGAVDRLLTRVGEMRLAYAPFMEEARRLILQDALGFCREFLEENRADPLTRRETARAYARMAEIQALLGQHAEGEDSFRRGIELNEALAAEFPSDPEHRRNQVAGLHDLASLLRDKSRPDAAQTDTARAHYNQALALASQLAREHPQQAEYGSIHAKCLHSLAQLDQDVGRLAAAEEGYRQTLLLWDQLCKEHPAEADFQHYRAKTRNEQGLLYIDLGRPKEAESAFAESLQVLDKLAKNHPKNTEIAVDVAAGCNNLASWYQLTERLQDALPLYEKSLGIRQSLADNNPKIPEFQNELASAFNNLGTLELKLKHPDKAEARYRRALELRGGLAASYPQVQKLQGELAGIHNNLAQLYGATGRVKDAEKAMLEAVRIQERLVKDGAAPAWIARDLGSSYMNLGLIARQVQDNESALAWYAKSDKTLAEVLAREPQNAEVRSRLIDTLKSRAYLLTLLEKNRASMPDWDRLLALARDPERLSFRVYRLRTLARLGEWPSALPEADLLAKNSALGSDAFYDMACFFGRAAEEPANMDRAEALGRQGVAFLEKAFAAGQLQSPARKEQIQRDRDLWALRWRRDFQSLVRSILQPAR